MGHLKTNSNIVKNTKSFISHLTLLVLSFLFTSHIQAQNKGKITGKVFDYETGEVLIGVNVSIEGTYIGSATDIDGNFVIVNITPGIYTIKASYVSYSDKRIEGVEVKAGETISLNFELASESFGLEEVTVTAEAVKSSEAGLLSIQKKAVAVQDGISSEQISRNSDGNVGSAMKRVTGVSIVNGKDVFVRGLGNRYSNVQLNGSQMPSTDPNKKEAPVDILSSGIVENIIVQKTYTADQDGEFSGGSIQIITKEFPSTEDLKVSYGTSVNSVTTGSSMNLYERSSTDFLGYDSGMRNLPSIIDNTRMVSSNSAAVANQLHSSWSPIQTMALPSQKFEITYANQVNTQKSPVGLVASLGYKMDNSVVNDGTYRYIFQRNNSVGANYIKNSGRQSYNLNGLVNLFWKPSKNTKIGVKNLFTNNATNTYTQLFGEYYNYSGNNMQTVLEFDRRSVYSSSLQFETYFESLFNTKLDADVTYSEAIRQTPDRRNTQYLETEDPGVFQIEFANRGNYHFFSNQEDRNISTKLGTESKVTDYLNVKLGGTYLNKNRDFSARILRYQDLQNKYPISNRTLSPNLALSSDLVESGDLDFIESTNPMFDTYNGLQDLVAGYISANWYVTNTLNLELGVRNEYSNQRVVNGVGQQRAQIETNDFLPAVNVTYRLSDNTNIRTAFSKTIARPEFREMSDFFFQDFIGGRVIYGNTGLTRTTIQNYDLRFEIYPKSGEFFAVSAFYKNFKNPIEMRYRLSQNAAVEFTNVPSANLYGLEFEARKSVTDNFKLSGNLSLIYSIVKIDPKVATGSLANSERPMYGQSPYTANLNAFYLIPKWKAEFNLSYNTFGPRISTIGSSVQEDDEYEQSFHRLDANFNKRFRKTNVKIGLDNILNDDILFKQNGLVVERYLPGMTFSVGISYSL